MKNFPIPNHSPKGKGGGKPSQHGHSSNQNGLTKNGSCGSTDRHSSRKGKTGNDGFVDDGDALEVFFDASSIDSASSSSSPPGHPEALEVLSGEEHSELCAWSDGSELSCDHHGDMASPRQTFPKDSQVVEMAPPLLSEVVVDDPQGVEPLFLELMEDIIGRIGSIREVVKLQPELGKALRNAMHRPAFLRNRPHSEGEFSPSYFMTDVEGDLHWHGYNTSTKEWTALPSFNFAKRVLPSPDPDLFKDYLMASDGGLLCLNVGKAPGREKLVMCNPLTHQVKVLPPLKYARHPVLMHLKVDLDSGHYKVFVAGSAAIGTEALSLKTEEYDSIKGVWECPDGSDLPCPPFGLNEYQNGVYVTDGGRERLMCIAIVDTKGRGVLVYDITRKKWEQGSHVKQLHIPLVRSEPIVSHLATTQIIECGGFVFVFSEQECGRDVYFVIHKLILEGSGDFTWDEVLKRKRTGGRGLLVYPEFTCVPVSDHELCIFNTVEHTIETIDLNNVTEVTLLQSAPRQKGNRFHSLNPIGFVFNPSFRSVVCPRGRNPEFRCDLKGSEDCSECERRASESFVRSGRSKEISHPADSEVVPAPPTEVADASIDFVNRSRSPEKPQTRFNNACGNWLMKEEFQSGIIESAK